MAPSFLGTVHCVSPVRLSTATQPFISEPSPVFCSREKTTRSLTTIGEAAGPLHPAGKARFGSLLVDVVTQGEYLEPDEKIEVVERRGNRVVVRAAR